MRAAALEEQYFTEHMLQPRRGQGAGAQRLAVFEGLCATVAQEAQYVNEQRLAARHGPGCRCADACCLRGAVQGSGAGVSRSCRSRGLSSLRCLKCIGKLVALQKLLLMQNKLAI